MLIPYAYVSSDFVDSAFSTMSAMITATHSLHQPLIDTTRPVEATRRLRSERDSWCGAIHMWQLDHTKRAVSIIDRHGGLANGSSPFVILSACYPRFGKVIYRSLRMRRRTHPRQRQYTLSRVQRLHVTMPLDAAYNSVTLFI